MKLPNRIVLVAGGIVLLSGSPDAGAEFTGITAEGARVLVEGQCRARWRIFATFDNPLDQLNVVSGNALNPVVISAEGPSGFFQVANPTGAGGDAPPTQFAVDFAPQLEHDTFLTIDTLGQFVADGLSQLNLDGAGGTAGAWNDPSAFGPDSFVLTNAGWRKNPGNADAIAGPDGRVAFGQFTVDLDASVDGIVRLSMIEDGVSMQRIGVTFNFGFASLEQFPCAGDTDCDFDVDMDDIVNVVLDWGTNGFARGGDLDQSGITDMDDIVIVIMEFGSGCY